MNRSTVPLFSIFFLLLQGTILFLRNNYSMSSSKQNHKEKIVRRNKEEKVEEAELPKYRDRAKEKREDQNPDYELTELDVFHAVAPPGNVDILSADAQKLSIAKSEYLGS